MEELGQLQRLVAYPMVEQESHGMREHLSKQSTSKVPQIACPYPLYGITLGELAENGVYPVAKPTEKGASFGMRVPLLGGVWSQKLHTHTRQLLAGPRRVVVAVSDDQPRGSLDDLGQHREFVGVGRGHRQTGDEPRPRDPHMHPKAVEGLLEEGVLAEGGLPAESTAAVGAGEEACRRKGIESQIAKAGSWGASGRSSCQRSSFIFQRLAACLAKVVRCTSVRAGNHSA